MKQRIPLEEDEQKALVHYLELKKIKFTAINPLPNKGTWGQRNKNKALGVRSGFPDLVFIINNNIYFMELKRIKNSVISDDQKSWFDALENCNGVSAFISYGFEQAKKTIDYLIKGEK